MESQVHTAWCNNSGEATGEIWRLSLLGVIGLTLLRLFCFLLVITCPAPDDPQNGEHVAARGYQYATSVSFKCNTNYTISDGRSIVCREDKTWSGTPPYCSGMTAETINSKTSTNNQQKLQTTGNLQNPRSGSRLQGCTARSDLCCRFCPEINPQCDRITSGESLHFQPFVSLQNRRFGG